MMDRLEMKDDVSKRRIKVREKICLVDPCCIPPLYNTVCIMFCSFYSAAEHHVLKAFNQQAVVQ